MSRPFFETLRELRAGKTLEDLSESLSELVTAVTTTGRPGEFDPEVVLRVCGREHLAEVPHLAVAIGEAYDAVGLDVAARVDPHSELVESVHREDVVEPVEPVGHDPEVVDQLQKLYGEKFEYELL